MSDSSPSSSPSEPARRPRVVTLLLVALGVLALVGGGLLLIGDREERAAAPRDLHGDPVRLAAEDTPAPEVLERMEVRPGSPTGDRLVVPSADLDVPLGSLRSVDGEVTPPGFTEAYLVRDLGVGLADAPDGTVYAVTHSVHDGFAPGNALIDVAAGRPSLADGAEVVLGDRTYRVRESLSIGKGDLPHREELWTPRPGRLVLITCLQRSAGGSVENVVVVGDLVEG